MLRALRIAAIAAFTAGGGALAAAQTVQTEHGAILVEELAALEFPWGMAYLPDGRLLITEKPGRLRIYADGTLSQPLGGVPAVAYRGQGGLLDVEIDPDFEHTRWVYLSYAEAAQRQPQPQDTRLDADPRLGPSIDRGDTELKGGAVARGRLEGDELRDVRVIWRQLPKTIGLGHFGGRLVFAADGTLFITSGERQRFELAQDLGSNLGKIARIRPDGSIPEDNPFAGGPGQRTDVWTLGHRNPLGAALHPESQALWIHEMGPQGGDELNLVERGRNYGWPAVSEGEHYNGAAIPRHASAPQYAAPITAWNPVISPSGLLFYTGSLFPAWRGHALLGGLSSQSLIRLELDGQRVQARERIALGQRIRDVIQAPDGALLALTDAERGALLRLSPARAPASPPAGGAAGERAEPAHQAAASAKSG